jgi:hypothetical protein
MKWISVEDTLPDEGVPVMVFGPDEYITCALITWEEAGMMAGWCWSQLNGWDLSDPGSYEFDDDYEYTHWQPIPPPPEAET